MPQAEWGEVFTLSVAPLELMVRGSMIYWFLFLIFRLVLRRDAGSLAMADVLLLVIVADAAQNAMAGGYKSVPDGMILIGTIVFWNLLLDWLVFRFRWLEPVIQPRKLCLVRDGHIQERNLRREFMTKEELMAKLREHGVDEVSKVARAYMEADGEVSVIEKKNG